MNAYLTKALKLLKKNYFVYVHSEDILVISNDKAELPFLKVITDENFEDNLLVSFTVDYPYASKAVQIVLELDDIAEVKVMEDFYISRSGSTYWGEEAHKIYAYDTQVPLDEIDPECQNRH